MKTITVGKIELVSGEVISGNIIGWRATAELTNLWLLATGEDDPDLRRATDLVLDYGTDWGNTENDWALDLVLDAADGCESLLNEMLPEGWTLYWSEGDLRLDEVPKHDPGTNCPCRLPMMCSCLCHVWEV